MSNTNFDIKEINFDDDDDDDDDTVTGPSEYEKSMNETIRGRY